MGLNVKAHWVHQQDKNFSNSIKKLLAIKNFITFAHSNNKAQRQKIRKVL